MMILAALTAYYIRFSDFFRAWRPAVFDLPLNEYLKIVFLMGLFWLIIFALSGLYEVKSARKLLKEIYRIILACSTGLMLIVAVVFLSRDLFDSRFIVLAGWVFSILYV